MRKLATTIAVAITTMAVPAVASAVPPVFNPAPSPAPWSVPAYCHGFDMSYSVNTFGNGQGVPGVLAGSGLTVQQAQQADKTYCRTGVLLP